MKKRKIVLLCLMSFIIMASIQFSTTATDTAPVIHMGNSSVTAGKHYYSGLTVSGTSIRTILISFSKEISPGDEIFLPTSPVGFSVSASSISNKYTKRINVDAGTSSSLIQSYLRDIGFSIGASEQEIQITLSTENILQDTFYNATSEHYYQFIPAGSSGISWTDAYMAAKQQTYMGRSGYLATVTSINEDIFLNSLSGGKTGWLGGTIFANDGVKTNAAGTTSGNLLYFSNIETSSFVNDGWYWACGPEIGNKFYNVNSFSNVPNADSYVDGMNPGTYYNWARSGSSEPNNTLGSENCLTTLQIPGLTGKHGTQFTWNDIDNNLTNQSSQYSAKGYFVEYGDLIKGDSQSASQSFSFDSSILSIRPVLSLEKVTRFTDTTCKITFTTDQAGTFYSKLVNHGAAVPFINTSGLGTSCTAGSNSFMDPSGLSTGPKDLYLIVKDSFGRLSEPLKIEIPETLQVQLPAVKRTSASTYTCDLSLSSSAKMITLSVNSGYFTVPDLGGGSLVFLGGTKGSNYIKDYSSASQEFQSVIFQFNQVSEAQECLRKILFHTDGSKEQTVTASASAVSPIGSDVFLNGHFYRYVSNSISWPAAVLASGSTTDPYFGGRGYLATATNQSENSILLKITENGSWGSDHWFDAWMGGLWQRNKATISAPDIIRGTDGNEISYRNLVDATTAQRKAMLADYTVKFSDFNQSNPSTYINAQPDLIKYYWIDGPEAGEEINYNMGDYSPWHVGEPNGGDFVYIGWEGAYWDDLSAYSNDNPMSNFATLNGYIVEFSGFDGGSTQGIIAQNSISTSADLTGPTISSASAQRSSETAASIQFSSTEAGKLFYSVVPHNSPIPNISTSTMGHNCLVGTNSLSLSSELKSGINDLYMIIVDPYGNESSLVKILIPAYQSPETPPAPAPIYPVVKPKAPVLKPWILPVIKPVTPLPSTPEVPEVPTPEPSSGHSKYAVTIGDSKAPKVTASGLRELFSDPDIYTEDDKKIEAAGGLVSINLEVQSNSTDLKDDLDKIKQLAKDQKIGLVLDISLYKTVSQTQQSTPTTTKIHQTNHPLAITIPIPSNLKTRKSIALYRVHDKKASQIPIGKEQAKNGEYCMIGKDNIVLYVNNFSTYAIGYKQDVAASSTEDSPSFLPLIFAIIVLIIATFLFWFFWRKKNKKEEQR